jgi:hypothetical protein
LVAVTVYLTYTDRRRDDEKRQRDRNQAVEDRKADRAQALADRNVERDLAAQRLADERALSSRRLAEEREESDKRLREERKAVEDRATRARQIDNAIALLARLAAVDQWLTEVPQLTVREVPGLPQEGREARVAVARVKEGALSEALALNNETGTRLYTQFAQLLVDAVNSGWLVTAQRPLSGNPNGTLANPDGATRAIRRTETDLRRFSRYVRLSLRQLIAEGEISEDSLVTPPILARAVHDETGWIPSTFPPGWDADTQLDPRDPWYHENPSQRR